MERKRKLTCGKCRQSCVSSMCLCCEKCGKEFHAHCEGLSQSKVKEIKNLSQGFICTDCCSVWGLFNFRASIERLGNAAKVDFECLKDAVEREAILLRGQTPFQVERRGINPGNPDHITNEFIRRCGGLKGKTAVQVDGDGNCLFNSISFATHGDQSKSAEIKTWTCIEMVKNRDYYKRLYKQSDIKIVSPDYEEECLNCAIDGRYSSAYMMHAAASALGVTVISVYPQLNGILDRYAAALNTTFHPRQGSSQKEVFIIWTSTYTHSLFGAKSWTPNHFCPLINIDSSSSEESVALHSQKRPQPGKVCPNKKPRLEEKTAEKEKRQTSSAFAAKNIKDNDKAGRSSLSLSPISTLTLSGCVFPDDSVSSVSRDNLNSTIQEGNTEQEFEMNDLQEEEQTEHISRNDTASESNNNRDLCDVSYEELSLQKENSNERGSELKSSTSPSNGILPPDNMSAKNDSCSLYPLPDEKFLKTEGLFQIVSSDITPVKEVPYGKKENVYCILKGEGKRASHHDDLGSWEGKKSRTCKSKFVLNNGGEDQAVLLFVVEDNDGTYCTEKQWKGKKMLVPLQPQPSKDSVITLHRYYTRLKRDQTYQKRVSWFSDLPANLSNRKFLTVVEYQGNLEETLAPPHGNSKVNTEPYMRTKPETIQKIKESVKHATPAETYEKLTEFDNSMDFSRNLQQCRNFRKNRDDDKKKPSRNEADEILEVLRMFNSGHPYVAEIIHDRDTPKPIIICYTEEQMHDLRSFVMSNAGVLGVDRTFNLGPCYVTTVVYKSHKVVRRESGEPPIIMGPIMLHWDGKTYSYSRFFSHLKAKLDISIHNFELLIGTDDEKALTNAIDMTFPNASRKLCTKHIKDNIIRQLTDKIPKTTGERNSIIREIFGPTGVAHANDSANFTERSEAMKEKLRADHQDFLEYYTKYVEVKISDHCISQTDKLWTNNNTESMNHRLKHAIKWIPKKTDDLVEQLYNVVRVQMLDIRRALYGTGNFSLLPRFGRYKLAVAVWHAKSSDEKQAYYKKFLQVLTRERKPETVTSSDGQYSVRCTQNVAKKPHQKTRVRSTKTKTPKKGRFHHKLKNVE